MAISLETQEKAKEIILAGLRAQSHGSVRSDADERKMVAMQSLISRRAN